MRQVPHKFLIYALLISIGLGIASPTKAQTIIRDAEIESYLSKWFLPILEANNMRPSQVNIVLVQSDDVNAFVAGGSNIFFYTGLIEMTDGPGELIGVMAHELGHITGGHLIRGRDALEQASYESLLGTILGLGAALATGDTNAVGAGSSAGSSLAQRRFLSTSRTYESSADQAAITSMKHAGMPTEGLLTFLQKLEGQELLTTSQQSEYVRTHPLTRNRVDTMKRAVEKSESQNAQYPPQWIEDHKRMRAKLMGFIHPEQVEWSYESTDKSVPALYARSIAAYRQNNLDIALKNINELIAKEPKNPYFYELKGQMLVEFNKLDEGITNYKIALKSLPRSGLILTALGQAQIQQASNSSPLLNEAIKNLKKSVREEPLSSRNHRLLATAYGRLDQEALAQLHLAEEALLQRRCRTALKTAKRALASQKLKNSALIRAEDIISACEQQKTR